MDWTQAHLINYSDHSNEVPFVSGHVHLSQFPSNDFALPGVGLAAANPYKFFVPIHGKTTNFDQTKVIPKTSNTIEIKTEGNLSQSQSGFGSNEVAEKQNEINVERQRKRKELGEEVFNFMQGPGVNVNKIKTAKLEWVPPQKTEKPLTTKKEKVQKGQGTSGSSKVHKFKK